MLPIYNENDIISHLSKIQAKRGENYYAFYSSWFGGVVKNPSCMLIPIDDHLVHRGDGVFEAMKAVDRSVYLMDEHLQRIFISAEKISLKPSVDTRALQDIIIDTLRISEQNNAIIRVFLSRGPGSFSVNPYDTLGAQLYVVVTDLVPPADDKYSKGVSIGKSHIPTKPSWMAQVKSCNYLANVLMKKEAVDRSLDYVIGVDEDGYITESATENIMIVDQQGIIKYPILSGILKGTTMMRACELAEANGYTIQMSSISLNELLSAQEIMITGTSLNILPVIKYENQAIGSGLPGAVAKHLNELMLGDIKNKKKSISY